MSEIKDGGPAFPIVADGGPDSGLHPEIQYGMSLRDFFAGMAMQGILAANAQTHEEVTDQNVDYVVAREAYRSADAMLAERSKNA